MRDLELSSDAAEGLVMDLIFDACRANPERNTWTDAHGRYEVIFRLLARGGHEAFLCRKSNGDCLASAIVDGDDV